MKELLIILSIIVVIGVVVYVLRKRNFKKVTDTDIDTGSRVAAPRWVVGSYNIQTNKTWVFPEGNPGGGHYVDGTVNSPQGTTYTPHN